MVFMFHLKRSYSRQTAAKVMYFRSFHLGSRRLCKKLLVIRCIATSSKKLHSSDAQIDDLAPGGSDAIPWQRAYTDEHITWKWKRASTQLVHWVVFYSSEPVATLPQKLFPLDCLVVESMFTFSPVKLRK